MRWIAALLCLATAATTGTPSARAQTVYHVDAQATLGGDGLSWSSAFRELRSALAQVVAGDEIWIAEGSYAPAATDGDRTASFRLVDGAQVFGGFAGNETERDQRDSSSHPTILTGDLHGDDGALLTHRDDNCYTVIDAGDVGAATTLDGCVITGGNADGPEDETAPEWQCGGALWCNGGSPTVINCVFRDNSAWRDGGAICLQNAAAPTIIECAINDNVSLGGAGGGLSATASMPMLVDCSFHGNAAGAHNEGVGGAIYSAFSAMTLSGCSFTGNFAEHGGAMYTEFGDDFVTGCSFQDNRAVGIGGACWLLHGRAAVARCTFDENSADLTGGAIHFNQLEAATLRDCVFTRNTGLLGGGILDDSSLQAINCVFSRNTALGLGGLPGGGGVYTNARPGAPSTYINCSFSGNTGCAMQTNEEGPDLLNCVLWGNEPYSIHEEDWRANLFTCNVEGGWDGPGAGNKNADPRFVEPCSADDLRLAHGSPCLDAGDDALVPMGIVEDAAGQARIQDSAVDIGAYEGAYDALPVTIVDEDVDSGTFAIYVLCGQDFDPMRHAAVLLTNHSGPDDATVAITQSAGAAGAPESGFATFVDSVTLETTLPDGQFAATIAMPFTAADLGSALPLEPDAVTIDDVNDTWTLAVAANAMMAPGQFDPIGARWARDDGGWSITAARGDFGVAWDSSMQRGFAWANVDRAGTYAVGVPTCRPDCAQPPNGEVDFEDVRDVIWSWFQGDAGGPADVNLSGTIDTDDLLAVLDAWGACP